MRLLALLRRPIDPAKHIQEIDGLRLLAIGNVILGHIVPSVANQYSAAMGVSLTNEWVLNTLADGRRGVILFFVISGFVLSLPFLRAYETGRKVSTRAYFLRRLTRLEPPFVLCLVVMFIGDIILLRKPATEFLPHLVAGVPYLNTIIFGTRNPINSVGWSLEVEVQFYILMPLIAILLVRVFSRRRVLLVAGIVVSLLLQQQAFSHSIRWSESLTGSFHAFLAGVLIADLYLHERWEGSPGSRGWDLAFLVGLGTFVFMPLFTPVVAHPSVVLAACVLLVVGGLRGDRARRALRRPVVWTIGGMCYSIYLLHLQVIRLMLRPMHVLVTGSLGGFVPDLVLICLVMIPVILLVSGVFFVLVELPCMRWSQRIAARERARTA
jgi:peptidoglycan/LPS O-acetylase OafA/YrhL